MKKSIFKKLVSMTAAVSITASMAVMAKAEAVDASTLQIGDYVQMGTYDGTPILWRIVDNDEYGMLVLSDKVIDYKMFDGAGDDISTVPGNSHSRDIDESETEFNKYSRTKAGSNYWPDSNLRSWLNSDKAAGEIEWLCGNAPQMTNSQSYKDTNGFLTNFTQEENSLIKEVNHKTIVSGLDKDVLANEKLKTSDASGTVDPANGNLSYGSGLIKDYDDLYYQMVRDKVFILDVKQACDIKDNAELGDFYVPRLQDGTSTYAYYRNPKYDSADNVSRGSVVRLHNQGNDNATTQASANNNGSLCAVRPAFYLDVDNAVLASGNGSLDTPYTLSVKAPDFTATAANVGAFTGDDETAATAFKIDVTNSGTASGSFKSMDIDVTSNEETQSFENKIFTNMTLGVGASATYGLIVNGLNDGAAKADVAINAE